MWKKIAKWWNENKTTYLIACRVTGAETDREVFDGYNKSIPFPVTEDCFHTTRDQHGPIGWLWFESKRTADRVQIILKYEEQYGRLGYVSQGTSKRKHKGAFQWGIKS